MVTIGLGIWDGDVTGQTKVLELMLDLLSKKFTQMDGLEIITLDKVYTTKTEVLTGIQTMDIGKPVVVHLDMVVL